MLNLFNTEHWKKKREDYMQAARGCRDTLINSNGPYRYPRDDERVKKALQFWVDRARRAHAIALEREPVIPNFTFISNQGGASFPVYAE